MNKQTSKWKACQKQWQSEVEAKAQEAKNNV